MTTDGHTPNGWAPVMLRCETQINGRTVSAQQSIPQRTWDAVQHDPAIRTEIERSLRLTLAHAIVHELNPTITVHLPTGLDEAVTRQAAEEQGGQQQ